VIPPTADRGDWQRRAHGSESASMECGGPVASPDTAMSRRWKIMQEVICGKGHRILHTQQLPQESKSDPSARTRESDRVRLGEKEVGLSREVLATVSNSARQRFRVREGSRKSAKLAISFVLFQGISTWPLVLLELFTQGTQSEAVCETHCLPSSSF
jgi:hypothetical protein